MKIKTCFLTLAAFVTLVACKKDYTCECSNPGGKHNAFTTKDTKANAKKKCDDYHKSDSAVVWSETHCSLK